MYSTNSDGFIIFIISKSPTEGTDFPILELDLGWELPDFASIGMHICLFPVKTVHRTSLKFNTEKRNWHNIPYNHNETINCWNIF